MKRALALALLLSFGLPAAAQEKERPTPPAKKTDPQEIVGVRYTAELKSGRKVRGVVRASGVFEVRDAAVWREADQEEPGAGVRLWFPQSQFGYIFVRVKDLERLEEAGEVTVGEAREVARAIDAARERAKRERAELVQRWAEEAAADALRKAAAKSGADDEEGSGDEGPERKGEGGGLTAEHADLLVRFPPTRWSPDTPVEIERRKLVLGLFPNAEEKAFLAVFPKWKAAYALWKESQKKSQKESQKKPAEGGGERPAPAPQKGSDEPTGDGAGTSRDADRSTAERH